MLCNLTGMDVLENMNVEVLSLNLENTYCLITAGSNSDTGFGPGSDGQI